MTIQSIIVKALRPTQIAVGKKLVKAKRKGLRKYKKQPSELVNFILENPIRVIAGPGGRYFIVDHHHLAYALLSEGFETVPVILLGDLTQTPRNQFWSEMHSKGWVYPCDGKGRKRPLSAIPRKIEDLQDDPYRSLAGFVRHEGGFMKSQIPYAEFQWANYFRPLIANRLLKKNFDKAVGEAMKLSHATDASRLPGYHEVSAKKQKLKSDDQ